MWRKSCRHETLQHDKVILPRTPMTSIFEGHPLKTKPFPGKTRVLWVPGMYNISFWRIQHPPHLSAFGNPKYRGNPTCFGCLLFINICLAKLRSLAKGLTFSRLHLKPYRTQNVKDPKGTSKICYVCITTQLFRNSPEVQQLTLGEEIH